METKRLVDEIRKLKEEKNALILVHNYQRPEIYHNIADITGDSLALAKEARSSNADIIVLCGVHFMAETAKILNPSKKVLIPDPNAGCSLASGITAEDVRMLKSRHPDVPVVTYVNSSAEVKAESDICCTSANAVEVVESLGAEEVIFIPDEYLGKFVQSKTKTRLILWNTLCELHMEFTAEQIADLRAKNDGIHIVAHPECSPSALAVSDFIGSTTAMIDHVKNGGYKKVALITECSMVDNIALDTPGVEYARICKYCPHMQLNDLPKVLAALKEEKYEVEVPEEISIKARRSVERMLAVGRGKSPEALIASNKMERKENGLESALL